MSVEDPLVPVAAQLRGRRAVDDAPPDDEDSRRPWEVMLELNAHRIVSGSAILNAPPEVPSLWGSGHQCLWAQGEPLILVGGDGVGKTTIAQQLALALAGIKPSSLLGFPVASDRRVLYLACDRPAQAFRSFARMVTESDLQGLQERLVLWRGPLPFDLATEPDALLGLAKRQECDVVIIDSLKDVAADISREETGQGLNRAHQQCCADGVDVLALHHHRKQQAGAGQPRHLSDVYGSRWIPAGAGSVIMLWGEAGDPVVELTHLKQPDETVGPFQVAHDHAIGSSSVIDQVDAYSLVMAAAKGITAAEIAVTLYGHDDTNSVRKVHRVLDRLVKEERIHREDRARGGPAGREPSRFYPVTLLRQGGSDDGA